MSKTVLTRHSVWDIFGKTENYEIFQAAYVPETRFKSQVSENVKSAFKLIQKLIAHSYFEYDFLGVARAKVFMTFELGLKERYQELHGKEYKKDLDSLIRWFHQHNYFETEDIEFLLRIKNLRNWHAHNRANYPGFSPMTTGWFKQVMYCINDLYEDRELRVQRFSKRNELESVIQQFKKPVLVFESGFVVVQKIEYLFLNNKLSPSRLTIGFTQINILEKDKEGLPKLSVWKQDFKATMAYKDRILTLKEYGSGRTYTIEEAIDDFALSWHEAVDTFTSNNENSTFRFHLHELDQELVKMSDEVRATFFME